MSKSREFWISFYNDGDFYQATQVYEDLDPDFPTVVHTIEMSAYEKLQKQNEIMREALEFYKNKNSWRDIYGGGIPQNLQCLSVIRDSDLEEYSETPGYNSTVGGKKARKALAKLEKDEHEIRNSI